MLSRRTTSNFVSIERIEGFAIVARASNGQRVLLMSQDIRDVTIEAQATPDPIYGDRRLVHNYSRLSIDFRQYGVSLWEPDPTPPPEVRGIYLPDMSFRALPPPED